MLTGENQKTEGMVKAMKITKKMPARDLALTAVLKLLGKKSEIWE